MRPLSNLVSFFGGLYEDGAAIGQAQSMWLLSTGDTQPYCAGANQAAFFGPLGIAAKSTGHTVFLDNAFRSTLDILESPQFNRVYYNTSLGLISLLEMSGNIREHMVSGFRIGLEKRPNERRLFVFTPQAWKLGRRIAV